MAAADGPTWLPRVPHYANICSTAIVAVFQMISHFQCRQGPTAQPPQTKEAEGREDGNIFLCSVEIKFVSITIALTYNLWASRISQQQQQPKAAVRPLKMSV